MNSPFSSFALTKKRWGRARKVARTLGVGNGKKGLSLRLILLLEWLHLLVKAYQLLVEA
mgnify:CR=1 FL=1